MGPQWWGDGTRANPARGCISRFARGGPIRSFASMPAGRSSMNLRRARRIRGSHCRRLPNRSISRFRSHWRTCGGHGESSRRAWSAIVLAKWRRRMFLEPSGLLEDAVKVSLHRSRIQAKASGSGGMLARWVTGEADDMARCLNGLADRAVIAAVNSRSSCTVSGDPDGARGDRQQADGSEHLQSDLEGRHRLSQPPDGPASSPN